VSTPKLDSIQAELDAIRAAGRWRETRPADPTLRANFSSNDYLGLAVDPRVTQSAAEAAQQWGSGAGASRLMAGQHEIHAELEAALANFFAQPAALLFPSGYQANLGTLTALAGRDDAIYSDALNHASLIDGARLSRAEVKVYAHNDVAALEALLAEAPEARRRVIVTESVFSMDGDLAPVAALSALAARHGAWLVVDEAHAIGVYGEGCGVCAAQGVKPDVLLGTLSKALGSQGGFVACAGAVRDLLVNRARTFIFSTGLAPACAAAALEALKIIRDEPGQGREVLLAAKLLRDALHARDIHAPGEAQIVPVLLGDEALALRVAAGCAARGARVHAIRPPTVPAGTCRLRLSVNALHSDTDLVWLAGCIADAMAEAVAEASA